jgi:hypothetical protein
MRIQAREIRHTVLLFLIVAIVPLIFFPNDLGLKFGVSMPLYLLAELVYYGIVISIFLDSPSAKDTVSASTFCLGFRLLAGLAFASLLFLMNAVSPVDAFGSGLWEYKPAVLLHTLTMPFVLMSAIRSVLRAQAVKQKTRIILGSPGDISASSTRPDRIYPRHDSLPRPVIRPGTVFTGQAPEGGDIPVKGFEAAVRHVFELSAVKFCLLVDEDGLPVAFAGDEEVLREIWSAMGRLLVDQIQSSLLKAGDLVLQGFDLSLDTYRLHAATVCGLWLVVGADRQSEELEKVRIAQAVEMIRKTYEQKYSEIKRREVPEADYV